MRMAPTKAQEIEQPKTHDRSRCTICNPKPSRVREDQVWGVCPTNRPHAPHPRRGR